MAEKIDRSKIKEPREVSGWGEDGRGGSQDDDDIAKKTEKNPEFQRDEGPARTSGGTPEGE